MNDTEGRAVEKKRTTITIDPDVHRKALARAQKIYGTDFAGLVTKLLVEDINSGPRLDPDDDGVHVRPTPGEPPPKFPSHLQNITEAAARESAEQNKRKKNASRRGRVE